MGGKGSLQEPISHLPLHSHPTPRTTSCKVGLCVFQGGFSRALCCCPRWRCPAGQHSSLSPSAKAPGACLTEGAGEPSGSCGERRETFRKLWRVSLIQSPVQGLPEPWGHRESHGGHDGCEVSSWSSRRVCVGMEIFPLWKQPFISKPSAS